MNTSREAPIDWLARTKAFALSVIRLYVSLNKQDAVVEVIGKQLLRSGTSVGAQYCEATRARSLKEFISKFESSLQELEESRYWLELLPEVFQSNRLEPIHDEATQLIAIFISSIRTAKQKLEQTKD